MNPLCLQDLRVVDLTQVIAGPYCAMQLAQLGAHVTKVEAPSGDPMRWRGGSDTRAASVGCSTHYAAHARGRSVVNLDWNTESGQQELIALLAQADVFVCNLRAHVLPRMGLAVETLRDLFPQLVVCTLSGYAAESDSCADWPAYDNTIQAASGLMPLNGQGEVGARVGAPIIDYACGMAALSAILAALFERTKSGQGQHVHISMLSVAHQLMTAQRFDLAATGKEPHYKGNAANSGEPLSRVFETGQGSLALAVNEPHQFAKLCLVLGQTQWLSDERFATSKMRRQHANELQALVEQCLLADAALAWEAKLCEAGVAAAAVRTLAQSIEHLGAQHDPDLFGMERGRVSPKALKAAVPYKTAV
ncbi:CoA transferase [Variovorax sp. PCZ-1]|uniref:CaiB/BaiF CoA transferase family protein n=1 Tax=Variovorax sp. PCZ-1 TaxID=2835533 RepID=UPI001BCC4F9C|nr:CoA transferase [Variovorax sp. PCZ-1]MBS7806308.1 CoA transferase [Variovorax sp. PCZ-1]